MGVPAQILAHREVAKDIFFLELLAPEIAGSAVPGQFIHVRCKNLYDPLLRRPFSLSLIDRAAGTVSIVYEVRGKGTLLLTAYSEGQFLDILGPLGKGFEISTLGPENRAVLLGGGVGAAPMAALAQALANSRLRNISVLLGAASKEKLFPGNLFTGSGAEIFLATDDGSQGHQGMVTQLLPQFVSGEAEGCVVFACGPRGMLKAVAEYCLSKNIPCQLSMEAVMACGVGACQGCACRVRGEYGNDFARVCKEGPVFHARDVVWE